MVALVALSLACSSRSKNQVAPVDSGLGGGSGAAGLGGSAGVAGSGGTASCSPPFQLGGKKLFQQTFNGLPSLDNPTPGNAGAFTTTLSEEDFGPGLCDVAVHFTTSAQQLDYPEIVSSVANIDYGEGSLRLWYRPDYPPDDAQLHPIIRSTSLSTTGGIRLFRQREAGMHKLLLEYYDGKGAQWTASALVDGTLLPQNEWSFIAASWKMNAPLRLWVGATEVNYATGKQETPTGMASAADSERLIIGYYLTDSASGWIDDLLITSGATQ